MNTSVNSTKPLTCLINIVGNFFTAKSEMPTINLLYDEGELLKTASLHRVVPLLYHCLKAQGMEMPEQISSAFWKIIALNVTKAEEFRNLLKILNKNGIEPICFKGNILSEIIYGNNYMRQYDDIDLMVDESDIEKTLLILAKNGYEYVNKYTQNEISFLIKSGWDFCMRNLSNGIIVEIGSSLVPHQYAAKIDFTLLLSYSEQKNIDNLHFRTLPPSILLPCLCVHGWKHLWERLGWATDLMSLLFFCKKINWSEVKEFTQKNKIKGMLHCGLALIQELWHSRETKIIPSEFLPNKNSICFAKKCITRMLQDDNGNIAEQPLSKTLFLHMSGHQDIFSKLRMLFLTLFYPTISDYRFLPLPHYLFFLYPLIRIFRILVK